MYFHHWKIEHTLEHLIIMDKSGVKGKCDQINHHLYKNWIFNS